MKLISVLIEALFVIGGLYGLIGMPIKYRKEIKDFFAKHKLLISKEDLIEIFILVLIFIFGFIFALICIYFFKDNWLKIDRYSQEFKSAVEKDVKWELKKEDNSLDVFVTDFLTNINSKNYLKAIELILNKKGFVSYYNDNSELLKIFEVNHLNNFSEVFRNYSSFKKLRIDNDSNSNGEILYVHLNAFNIQENTKQDLLMVIFLDVSKNIAIANGFRVEIFNITND